MFRVRELRIDDIPHGLQLSLGAGWNQTPNDWHRFLTLAPHGCFLAYAGEQPIGTVTTCRFGHVGWVGMMLVDPNWRRHGVGQTLLQRALDHLKANGAATVRLDATPAGIPLYRKFGFSEQFLLHRYTGSVVAGETTETKQCLHAVDESIMSLDCRIVGYDRRPLLNALRRDALDCRIILRGRELVGYGMSRPGSRATFIGPCVAGHPVDGRQLLAGLLQQQLGQHVYVDIPDDNPLAVETATEMGLKAERPLLRMVRGRPQCEAIAGLFASSGPEKG
jgi:GNAT superfamily N-acetyltransferase